MTDAKSLSVNRQKFGRYQSGIRKTENEIHYIAVYYMNIKK